MGEAGRQAWEEFQLWPDHLCFSHPQSYIEILVFTVIVIAGGSLGGN